MILENIDAIIKYQDANIKREKIMEEYYNDEIIKKTTEIQKERKELESIMSQCKALITASNENANPLDEQTLNDLKEDIYSLEEVDLNKQIKTVCVSCGAGARDDELVEMLNKEKIDLLIGGENKLSLAIKMRYYNICLIEVGHYNSEIICMEIFEDWLKELGIKTIKSKKDINPYN